MQCTVAFWTGIHYFAVFELWPVTFCCNAFPPACFRFLCTVIYWAAYWVVSFRSEDDVLCNSTTKISTCCYDFAATTCSKGCVFCKLYDRSLRNYQFCTIGNMNITLNPVGTLRGPLCRCCNVFVYNDDAWYYNFDAIWMSFCRGKTGI
mgnify:CR=1 FL=1